MAGGVFVMALSAGALLSAGQVSAAQTVPYKVNFQGRLTNGAGNVMPDGLYNIKFRIWNAASAGTNTWTETRETTNRIQVTNGLFSVQLGDVTALSPSLFNSQPMYFEVELPTPATATCSTAGCAVFDGSEVMTPRQPFGASAYAMNADTVDGIDGSSLVQLSPGVSQTGAVDVTGNIKSGGTVQANTLDAATAGALTVGSANASSIALAKNTTLADGLTLSLQGSTALNLGSTTAAGGIIFKDGTANNFNVTLKSVGVTASYTLSLPTAIGTAGQCLAIASITGSDAQLGYGACSGGGGSTLQAAYDGSTNPEFVLSATNGALTVRDAATPIGANLLEVQSNDGASTYFAVTASGVRYGGTARPTKKVTIAPEFTNTTFTGDGTANSGQLTTDFCSASGRLNINATVCTTAGDEHNYYSWTTTSGTNDYDIYMRYQIPSDFDGFAVANTIKLTGWRSTATELVELAMFQADGAQCGTTTNVATTNTAWTQVAMGGTHTSCAIAAGDIVTFRIKVTAAAGNSARISALQYEYLSKF